MASVPRSQENVADDTRKRSICTRIMAYHPEVLCFLLAAVLSLVTRYGHSVKSKPLVILPPEPKQFFPINSQVLDVPHGDLNIVFDNVIDHEFVIVMYYAPWCAKCMQVRWEFHQAAKHLQNVKFIAVNCWWWRGQCRQRFKFLMFPVLIAYQDKITGFKYSGILSADHIVKFIDDMFYPLKYLRSSHDVKEFIASNDAYNGLVRLKVTKPGNKPPVIYKIMFTEGKSDATTLQCRVAASNLPSVDLKLNASINPKQKNSLIGYFGFNESPQPPGFQQFYYASLRLISADPHQPVRCAVISRRDLFSFYGIKCFERIFLSRTGSATLKYPLTASLNASAITNWVLSNKKNPVVRWIVPPGVKSLTLSEEINKGPALVLFTPVNPLFDINIYLHALKEVALAYRNCNGTKFSEIIQIHSKNKKNAIQLYLNTVKMCREMKMKRLNNLEGIPCCLSIIANDCNFSNGAKNICEYCINGWSSFNASLNKCSVMLQKNLPPLHDLRTFSANSCHQVLQNYNINQHNSVCCVQHSSDDKCKNLKVKRTTTDPYILKSISEVPQHLCTRLVLHRRYSVSSSISDISNVYKNSIPDQFRGVGCTTNKSVSFYVMDSIHHSVFGERLGLSVKPSQPNVVLFDKQEENNYVLNENFTVQNIATFVMNYTNGMLRRNQRDQPLSLSSDSLCNSNQDICVIDVSAKTFNKVVMDESKDVLLLYYTPWCGFCSALYHVFLSLVKYFQNSNSIVFTRINGDTNDLPWEFDVEHYPTILFFPAFRKSESLVFPDGIPKSLSNLIKFILSHATHNLQLNSISSLCHENCITKNKKNISKAILILEKTKRKTRHRLRVIERRKIAAGIEGANVMSERYSKIYNIHLLKLKTIELKIENSRELLDLLDNSDRGVLNHKDLKNLVDGIHVSDKQSLIEETSDLNVEFESQNPNHFHSEL